MEKSNMILALSTLLSAAPIISPSAMAAHKEPATSELLNPPPPLLKATASSSYMAIPMKERAADLVQAFEILKKEKTPGKIYFQLADNSSISNIIDMTLLPNSSLILFHYNTSNQGIRIQVVKVEDITGLSYY
jgi:hypothetical protein